MAKYYHAHKVITEKCRGHMKCMRSCPTEAIRVRNGKATFSEELCVDCGICISVCPSGAMVPISDPITEIDHFKYKVAVPAAVLYSQFDASIHPYIIHLALKEIGFDRVVDLSITSKVLATALVKYMQNYRGRLPLISSHCPALLRLIQVKYPDLVELIIPLDVPRELTAREIKKNLTAELGINPEDIGVIYISPCPAKIVSIKQPAEKAKSWFDGAISIKDIYSAIYPHVMAIKEQFDESQVPKDFFFNTAWARLGSIMRSVKMENWLAVSGLNHVMRILDDIENSRLRNVEFIEAVSCMLGCIGGPFNVQSPYVARANEIKQREKYDMPIKINEEEVAQKLNDGYYFFENPIPPRPTKYFDTDLETSIKRMRERDRIFQKLPQIDCGCCGAPTCLAFAEDFVRGEVELLDCIFFRKNKAER